MFFPRSLAGKPQLGCATIWECQQWIGILRVPRGNSPEKRFQETSRALRGPEYPVLSDHWVGKSARWKPFWPTQVFPSLPSIHAASRGANHDSQLCTGKEQIAWHSSLDEPTKNVCLKISIFISVYIYVIIYNYSYMCACVCFSVVMHWNFLQIHGHPWTISCRLFM